MESTSIVFQKGSKNVGFLPLELFLELFPLISVTRKGFEAPHSFFNLRRSSDLLLSLRSSSLPLGRRARNVFSDIHNRAGLVKFQVCLKLVFGSCGCFGSSGKRFGYRQRVSEEGVPSRS